MNALDRVYRIAKADFKERVRSYKFLIILGFAMFLSFTFIAPTNAEYITNYVMQDNVIYRGVYNSAWLGSMMALSITVFLSLFGFYLIRSNVERDIDTGMNQILGSCSVKKSIYIFGKFLSNFCTILTIILIAAFSTIVIQFIRGEVLQINLVDIFSPIIFIVLPSIAVVSAIAILFESISFLRGSLGSVAYFLLWMAIYIITMETNLSNQNIAGANIFKNDLFGMTTLLNYMLNGIKEVFPNITANMIELFGDKGSYAIQTFNWGGIKWSASIILVRFIWVLVALLIVEVSSVLFRGFDVLRKNKTNLNVLSLFKKRTPINYEIYKYKDNGTKLTKLKSSSFQYNYISNIIQEIKLSLKLVNIWCFLAMIIILIFEFVAPIDSVKAYLAPVSTILPIGIWSILGLKEDKYNLSQILSSCSKYKTRQFLVQWISAVVLTAILQVGLLVKLLLSGGFLGFISCLVGIIFVPSLAFLLGTISGNSRLFEIVYSIIWYFGLINNVPALDFIGIFTGGNIIITLFYFIISIACVICVYLIKENKDFSSR